LNGNPPKQGGFTRAWDCVSGANHRKGSNIKRNPKVKRVGEVEGRWRILKLLHLKTMFYPI